MTHTNKNGFTLMELLIGMAMASIVMVAIVSTYTVQVRAKNTQEVLTDMNQTARAALEIMTHEIRMAGLDPTGDAGASIITADVGELIFSLDRGDGATNAPNGDCCDGNEQIRYRLMNDDDGGISDGINDDLADECHLGRETGPGLIAAHGCGGGTSNLQPLARNVDVLNFVYLTDDNDGDGLPDVLATPVATQALRNSIRTIQVTIVARAGEESRGFFYAHSDTNAYENLQGQQILAPPNDGFRRLQLSTTIACRNIGL
jgi:type IV pilus assembly protein PilW